MPISVMVVNDSENMLEMLRNLLIEEPYRVFAFDNPFDALSLLKATEFPVVLVEHHMHKMDGITFLKRMRQASPNSIGILMTAFAEFKIPLNALYPGCVYRYVQKPLDNNEIIHVVRMAATQWELNVERRI